MTTWKKVSKAEFDTFLSAYERPLNRDVTTIFEPPMVSYNDFSDGQNWPHSTVARVILYADMKGYSNYRGEQDEYFLRA